MTKFSVIGSCISRDLFPMEDPEYTFHTDIRYTSPYTLVSAPVPAERRISAEDLKNDVPEFSTNWYRKNLVNDVNKAVFDALAERHGDYLIVDLADVRIPINEVTFPGDEGKYYISDSLPFKAHYKGNLAEGKFEGAELRQLNPREIPLSEWEAALERYAKRIAEVFDYSKVILIKNVCVSEYLDKSGALAKFTDGLFLDMIYTSNQLLPSLYEKFERLMPGCAVIDIPLCAVADDRNKWGKHPLHMTGEYYRYLLECINAITAGRRERLPEIYERYSVLFRSVKELAEIKTARRVAGEWDLSTSVTFSEARYARYGIDAARLHTAALIYRFLNEKKPFAKRTHYGINNQLVKDFFTDKTGSPYTSFWVHPTAFGEGFHIVDSLKIGKGCSLSELEAAFTREQNGRACLYIGTEKLSEVKELARRVKCSFEVKATVSGCAPCYLYLFCSDGELISCDCIKLAASLLDKGGELCVEIKRAYREPMPEVLEENRTGRERLIEKGARFTTDSIKYLHTDIDDLIKLFVFADICDRAGLSTENMHHYCVNNAIASHYASLFSEEKRESVWCNPLSFTEGTLLLDLKREFVSQLPSESDVLISIYNGGLEQRYVIFSHSLLENATALSDELREQLLTVKITCKEHSSSKELFLGFFSADGDWLERIKETKAEFLLSDIGTKVKYSVCEAPVCDVEIRRAAEVFLSRKRQLLEYLDSLTNHPKVTPGLELANTRALKLFDELYMKSGVDTLTERKLMFRQMNQPSSSGIKYTQKGSSFLLKKLDALCRKHGINYWMYNGSLLGACRHGNFVPWDDDIDIGVMRSDLKKLQEIIADDPHFKIDILYNFDWADRIYKFRFKNADLPCYVDIFPFDYCEDEKGDTWERLKPLYEKMIRDFRNKSKEIGHRYVITFDVPEEHLKIFNGLFDKYAKLFEEQLGITDKPCKNIIYGFDACFIVWWPQVYPVDKVFPLSTVNFDGADLLAFGNAEEILVKNYKQPYTLPKDIVSHRHTERPQKQKIQKLEELMEQLKDYNF